MIWQVKDYADGWITFANREDAMREVEAMGEALVRYLPADAARSASPRQVEGQVPGPNRNSSIPTTPPAPRKTTAMESHNHSEGEG